jgi:hypothetical protein
MRISSWGFLLLGIYLILVGISSFGMLGGLGQVIPIVALVAGILIIMEHWRR